MNLKKLLFGASLIILAACGGQQQSGNSVSDLSGQILIDGSSTVYPITEAIAEEFRTVAPNVKVTIGVSGTGGGFKKFGRGEIDINDASRPIKEKEAAACKELNIEYLEVMVAYDGMAIIANKENSWLTSITTAELKKIWEPAAEGVVKNWSDVRAEWPSEPINLYGADAASGTYDYFTEAIVGESGKSRGDFTNSSDDNVLVQGVSTDKNALGFFGMAYYEENADKLKLVAVNNGNGDVLPTFETVSNGSYSPLSRPIYIYVTKAAAQRPETKAFVNFYIENAGKISKDVGYVSTSAETQAEQKAKFEAFIK